jgi:hypothetical protein
LTVSPFQSHAGRVFTIALSSLLLCVVCLAQNTSSAGTTTFVLDGNRMYAVLDFVRPDGSIHRALAFVDMGSPAMAVRESLFKDLQLDKNQPLRFKVGGLPVEVPGTQVERDPGEPRSLGTDLKVEGMLAAGTLQRYQVVIDYGKRTLTLAQPGTIKPAGVSVPFQINRQTGLIAVVAVIDGTPYLITIDNGSAYTWCLQTSAGDWLVAHPEWERGVGAVGTSNMMMSGDRTETSGTLLRIPKISLGPLILKDVGVLAAGPSRSLPGNVDLFDWYSQKNAAPVIGWIGGNVLKGFRLTVDYPNQRMYWLRQAELDPHDLDQVGLTLQSEGGAFIVAAIATRHGRPTVEGVMPGDRLIRIGSLDTKNATWGAIYNALHGKPGTTRRLVLERNGKQLTVTAKVTAF